MRLVPACIVESLGRRAAPESVASDQFAAEHFADHAFSPSRDSRTAICTLSTRFNIDGRSQLLQLRFRAPGGSRTGEP